MKTKFFVIALVATCGCTTLKKDGDVEEKLKGLVIREAAPLPKTKFQIPGLRIEGEIETTAKAVAIKEIPKGFSLDSKIGAANPILCQFTKGRNSPAVAIKDLTKKYLPVDTKTRITFLTSDVAQEIPFIVLYQSYTSSKNGEMTVSTLKIMAAQLKGDVAMFCVHDEPGYMNTFARVTLEMLNGLVLPPDTKTYREIQTLKVDEVAVGYIETYMQPVNNGRVPTSKETHMVVPITESNFRIMYDVVNENSESDGSIIKGLYQTYEGDSYVHDLEVNRLAKNKYSVSGISNDKKIKQTFELNDNLVGVLGEALFLKSEFRGDFIKQIYKGAKLSKMKSKHLFVPSFNNGGAIEVKYQSEGELDSEFVLVNVEVDKFKAKAQIDENGLARSVIFNVGKSKTHVERKFLFGKP